MCRQHLGSNSLRGLKECSSKEKASQGTCLHVCRNEVLKSSALLGLVVRELLFIVKLAGFRIIMELNPRWLCEGVSQKA